MNNLHIYCDQFDFSAVESAFEGEYLSDAPLAAEIVFVSAEEIKELNAKHRGKDAVTDVLSFPSLDGIRGKKILKKNFPFDIGEDGEIFIGSIAICEDRAKEQAEEYGHSYNRELHYLIVHGLCHLLGYDHPDEDSEQTAQMRQLQKVIISKIEQEFEL